MSENRSLSAITTEIASALGKELDEPFKRMLADKVDSWRSTLLHRSLQEKPNEAKFFKQTLFVPLESHSPVPVCVDAPVCPVLRSTQPLPRPLRYGPTLFQFVGSVDGNTAFSHAPSGTMQYFTAGRYSKRKIYYDLVNDYLEVYGTGSLPSLRVEEVFDRPSEVMKFNCEQSATGCDYWDQPYPASGEIIQQIVQYILTVDFNRPVTPANKEVDVNPQKEQHEPSGR